MQFPSPAYDTTGFAVKNTDIRQRRMPAFLVELTAAAVLWCAGVQVASAQTEGRVSVGGSVTVNAPTDDNVQQAIGVGPLVRLNPKRGWGPAGALNWFRADLSHPDGSGTEVARLRVRPLMGGVAYAVGPDRALVSFSIVAGPSFNSVRVKDEFLESLPAGVQTPATDVNTSFAVRPGVGLTLTMAPRVAFVGFAGYLINRPEITFRDQFGQEFRDRWKADAVVLSAGLVYSLF
jgi:Outer membrane protein beta-barrel domain